MSSAIVRPKTGDPLKPQVPIPDATKKRSTSVSPRIGDESGDMSQRPVHCRMARAPAMNGRIWIERFAASERKSYVERVEYVLYGRISAPARSSPRAVCDT